MPPYFRVDKRTFSVGDQIITASEYYVKFACISQTIENGLDAARPRNVPSRRECLFVFEDLEVARKHWSKMADGKLYRVDVEPQDHIHRGDMALMDAMKALAESGTDWQSTAQHYWAGGRSDEPEIEVLVRSAIIAEFICVSDSERRAYLLKRWGFDSE